MTPRADISPICILQRNINDLLFHGCQTDMGASGSPIFAIVPCATGANTCTELKLVGIVSGSTADYKTESSSAAAAGLKDSAHPNYGVSLSAIIGSLLRRSI